MQFSRDVFRFAECLKEIKKLSDLRYAEIKDASIDLSPEEKAELERFFKRDIEYGDLSFNAKMQCSLQSVSGQRKDPFLYSSLPDQLELETWTPEVALQILAGIDPQAAILDWSYENFMGAEIHEPKIKHATCFSDKSDLYDYPVEGDFEFSSSEIKGMIRKAEKEGSSEGEMKDLLKRLAEVERWSTDETSHVDWL